MNNKFEIRENKEYGYYSAYPIPSEEELTAFYEKKYYQEDFGQFDKVYKKEEIEYFQIDSKVVFEVFNELFPKSKRKSYLDIGCGEGFQSHFFHTQKWDISCLDYSDYGLKQHNPHLQKYFIHGGIGDINYKKKYSVIMLKNVLEHVVSPIKTISKIKDLMDGESLLSINVPNDYSTFQKYLLDNGHTENTWFNPPEHLHYFQFESMKKFLESNGLEIVKCLAGFPIELFLVNEHSNYSKNKVYGKAAHYARCDISSFLLLRGLSKYIKLMEAMAEVDFGRDIKIIAKLKN